MAIYLVSISRYTGSELYNVYINYFLQLANPFHSKNLLSTIQNQPDTEICVLVRILSHKDQQKVIC